MRVLLVQPPFSQVPGPHRVHAPMPPLGIAYLASYLREKMAGDLEIRILDALSLDYGAERVIEEAVAFAPDVVGYTSVTLTANFVKRAATALRKRLARTLQVAGGPHPSALPSDMLPAVDVVVRGEGEISFAELVARHARGVDFQDVPGTSLRLDGRQIDNPPCPPIEDLDAVPFPARDLLPDDLYQHHYPYRSRNQKFTTLFTARGCPFTCAFCGQHVVWGRRARYRGIDRVIAEIEQVQREYDTSFIYFLDDTFTLDRERVVSLTDQIIGRRLDLHWLCLSRADYLDDDLIERMKKAGCVEIQIGVESGEDSVLDSIHKKVDLRTLKDTFRRLHAHGIRTKGFFILGHFDDTLDSMRRTADTALALNPSWAFFSTLVPLPGSELYEIAVGKGYMKTMDWDAFNYHGKAILHTENFSAEDMDRMRRRAYRRFYLRPRKILSVVRDVILSGGYRPLWTNFLAFLNLSARQR